MKTIDDVTFPTGREQAVLTIAGSLVSLARRLGCQYERSVDGLGEVHVTRMQLDNGQHVLLKWRPDVPLHGISASIDEVADTLSAAIALVRELNLAEADVTWIAPSLLWRAVEVDY